MKLSSILLIAAAIAVLWVLFSAVTEEAIPVDTVAADYEATLPVTYVDGSTDTIKRFKTASAYYKNKVVKTVGFNLDVKFKPTVSESVRVLSGASNPDISTKVAIYFRSEAAGKVPVTTHYLNYYTTSDFSVLDRGTWYHLFANIEVSMAEIDEKVNMITSHQWDLIFVVTVWYNTDYTKAEAAKHVLEFKIPVTSQSISSGTPSPPPPTGDPDIKKGDPGSGIYDPSALPIVFDKPSVKKTQKGATSVTVPWQTVGGEPSAPKGSQLDPRAGGWF